VEDPAGQAPPFVISSVVEIWSISDFGSRSKPVILQSQSISGSPGCDGSVSPEDGDEITSASTNSNSIGLNIEYIQSPMAYITHRTAEKKMQKNGPMTNDAMNPSMPVTGLSLTLIVCAPKMLAMPQSSVKGSRVTQCAMKISLSNEPLVSFLARIRMLDSPVMPCAKKRVSLAHILG
jgi:hypothetical protein